MSPEQIARPRDVTHAADQFSFGAMAYQCLSRDVPFPGETVLAVIRAIAESEPRPLRELVPNLPPALEAVVRRMLSKDPAHRFASMREVGIALLPWASPHVRSQYERRFSTAKPEPTGEASETSPPIVPASPAATNAARRPISTLSSMVGERLVPRESRSFWVGGVGALVVAAGLGTWWFVGSSATTEEVRPAARAQPSATPAEPAALAPSEVEARPPAVDVPASEPSPTHSMQLAPPEAELFVDDVRVTPSSFSLSEGPHRVEVRAPGFVTQTFELGSSVDLPERVELEAVRRSSPRVDMRRNPRPRPEPTAVPAPEFRSPALDEPYEIN
jgi:serine/threonine protein kinase